MKIHYMATLDLCSSLMVRFRLSHDKQDLEEAMELHPVLVDDGYAEGFTRFKQSCRWAHDARHYSQPSILTAYEKAMSLMQEILISSPTLKTKHFLLTKATKELGTLPSDYASYQIENGQPKAAIETLERGRALLWSEMRGLRTCTEKLRAADQGLAEEFATINPRVGDDGRRTERERNWN
jgi:hypothetical protein